MNLTANENTFRMLDRAWQHVIKSRAGGICEICRASDLGLHAAHIYSRAFHGVRWDPRNGIAVCYCCHEDSTIRAWLEANDPERWQFYLENLRCCRDDRDIDLDAVAEEIGAVI